MNQHELLQDLKRLAIELGRAPTRDEYVKLGKFGKDALTTAFGSYSQAIIASGLQKVIKKKKKVDRFAELFSADISEQIKAHTQSAAKKPRPDSSSPKILVIGDLHFPFTDFNAVTALYQFAEENQPDIIIQVGDLYDNFSHGRFPRSRNIFNPKEEMELGFKMACELWSTLQRICPKAKCYQILGNHDVRPLKKIIENYPEGEIFFSIEKYFQFPNVETNMNPRQELIIDDICFIHGYLSNLGAHRDHTQMNTVCGHSHVGGVVYRNFNGTVKWELNAGYMGDPTSKALSYTAQKMVRWTKGWGFIDHHGPRFIPVSD